MPTFLIEATYLFTWVCFCFQFIDSSDSSQTITIVQPSEGQAYMTSRPHSVGSLQPSQVSGSDSSQARLQLVADQIQVYTP